MVLLGLASQSYLAGPTPAQAAQSSERDFKQIVALLEQGKLAEAELKLHQDLKADSGSVPALRLLAMVYQRAGKLQQAEGVLEKAAQLSDRKDPQTLFALCQTKFALKKLGEALPLAIELSALAADDAEAHYALGRLLRENSRPHESARELEKALTLAPTNPAVTTELIAAYLDGKNPQQAGLLLQSLLRTAPYDDLMQAGSRFGEAEQLDAAQRAFERAVELRPASADARFNLAFALYKNKEYSKALAALNQISRSQAELQPDYHYLRGKIEVALRHTKAATEHFLRALQQQPDNESLCVDTGLLFFQHEHFWKALEVFEPCARRLSDSSAVQTGLALTYFRLGKYRNAADAFKRVLRLSPVADAAREGLAFLFYISGNLSEARQILEERLGEENVDFYIYYWHAMVLRRSEPRGDGSAAIRSLDEALRRNPCFAPAYFQRGRIWAELGDTQRALNDFGTATRVDPNYAQPYYSMAQIYFKLGKKQEAELAQVRFAVLNKEQEEKEQKRQVENRLFQSLQ